MKPGQRKDPLVKCPFYRKEDELKIFCEGVQEFDAVPELKEYKKTYCKSWCYNKCLIAETMNRKWGYDAK